MSRARFIKHGQRQGLDTILKAVNKEMARFTLNDDKREYMRLSQVLISRIREYWTEDGTGLVPWLIEHRPQVGTL
jgi:hypothetical protein